MPYKNVEDQQAASHRWYISHREGVASRSKQKKQERLAYIRKQKQRPCADCQHDYPHWIMEFDHTRGVKLFCVGDGGRTLGSLVALQAEIAKCDVVCANCHKDRTWKRSQR